MFFGHNLFQLLKKKLHFKKCQDFHYFWVQIAEDLECYPKGAWVAALLGIRLMVQNYNYKVKFSCVIYDSPALTKG